MKKTISSFVIAAAMIFGLVNFSFAQGDAIADAAVETISQQATKVDKEPVTAVDIDEENVIELSFVQTLKQKYIEGAPLWMTPVLICLIIGLALSIERIV